jgi:hypothetical protein
MLTRVTVSTRTITTQSEIDDAYRSLFADLKWTGSFQEAKNASYNYRAGALAEKLLNQKFTNEVHVWLERKSTDFNPGTASKTEICTWVGKSISGNDWGAWKRLRLIALFKSANGLCFYTGQPLRFGQQDYSDEFAELDHVIPEMRDARTGFYGLDLSPVVICRLDTNRMRGHLPFTVWLDILNDKRIELERQTNRKFIEDARQNHALR